MRVAELNRKSGFSMLELLAVMSIMALLTTVGVTSYFFAVRGMARRSAVKHFASSLVVARQRAAMDNARFSVVLFNEVSGVDEDGQLLVRPSYVVCKEMGRITYVSGSGKLVDEFTSLDTIFGLERAAGDPERYQDFSSQAGGIKLYNLTSGGSCYVYPLAQEYSETRFTTYDKLPPPDYHIEPDSRVRLSLKNYAFEINTEAGQNSANWQLGDYYGIEASPSQNLPRGFEFASLNDNEDAFEYITFLPNGGAEFSSGSIRIRETRPPNRSVMVRVTSEGTINYNNNW